MPRFLPRVHHQTATCRLQLQANQGHHRRCGQPLCYLRRQERRGRQNWCPPCVVLLCFALGSATLRRVETHQLSQTPPILGVAFSIDLTDDLAADSDTSPRVIETVEEVSAYADKRVRFETPAIVVKADSQGNLPDSVGEAKVPYGTQGLRLPRHIGQEL